MTGRTRFGVAALAAFSPLFAVALATPSDAGPSMSTRWSNTGLSLDRCKSRAEEAVRDAGFRNVRVLKFSIFAERGDYSIMARCITEKNMIFFAVAGPQVQRTSRMLDDVANNY